MAETVLVVDDEEMIRELLFHVLGDDGYKVELASDGPAGIRAANDVRPDLILLDLMMPGMHGLEVCRRLKSGAATADIPVIVVTAVGQVTDKEAVLTSGADDFISKPFDPKNLRTRVGALLRATRAHQELDRILAYVQELEAEQLRERQVALAKALGTPWPKLQRASEGLPVLLVSEERPTLSLLQALLAEHGFRVFTAASGMQAWQLVRTAPVEGVILDVHMSDVSWLEVMQGLRQHDPDLPVVVLTNSLTAVRTLAALKAGADGFIGKGWDHGLIVFTTHQILTQRRHIRSANEEIRQLRVRLHELETARGRVEK